MYNPSFIRFSYKDEVLNISCAKWTSLIHYPATNRVDLFLNLTALAYFFLTPCICLIRHSHECSHSSSHLEELWLVCVDPAPSELRVRLAKELDSKARKVKRRLKVK